VDPGHADGRRAGRLLELPLSVDETGDDRAAARATTTRLAVGQLATWGTLYYAFAVIYPSMRAELGWSPALLSGAFSLGMLISGLAAPAIGRYIDQAGSRRVMSLGSLAASAGLLLWAAARHPVVFLVAWVIIGVAMAATLYEPAFATVVREHPRHRRAAILTIGLVGGMASTVFTPLTSWLADVLGWRGGLVALAALVGATLVPHLGLPAAPPGRGTARTSSPRRGAVTTSPPRPRTPPSADDRALGQGIVIASGVATAASVHAVALLLEVGHDQRLAVALVAGLGVAKVASRIALATVPARMDPRRIVTVVLVLEALGLAAALAPTPTVYLFPVLFGGGWGAMAVLKPLALASSGDVADFAYRSGRIHRGATMANAAAPLVLGAGVTWVAGYALLWWLLPGSLLVGALLVTAPDRQARGARMRGKRGDR